MSTRTRATSTSRFGVGRRENHDATDFYSRFRPPDLSSDDTVHPYFDLALDEAIVTTDAREISLPANSVALVVTSPPYFAGKAYEEALGRDGIPGSYLEYLQLLKDVFARCVELLEPGGRIAVNVANLGRKPYRSLSADVIRILQDDLGLLLRGEIIWQKGRGAAGSCAWGSYRSPANPVLRDLTERVVVASKGRFDRAKDARQRRALGLPHESSITTDEFLEATLDVWHLAPESARRVRHPAPFPVELPQRLIELYTYRGDLVLDPFMGAGSALVAAVRTGRRLAGYDIDPGYVAIARQRVEDEVARVESGTGGPTSATAAALYEGKAAPAIAEVVLADAGFRVVQKGARLRGLGVEVGLVARAADDVPWYFDVTGGFTGAGAGLARADTMWKALGRAHVLASNKIHPGVLVPSQLPRRGSGGDSALRAAGPRAFFDAVDMLSASGQERLRLYAGGG